MSATEYVSRRCQELWIDRGEVVGQKRYPRLVRARTILARELRGEPFRLSLPEIGRELGGRHHTTILSLLRGGKGKRLPDLGTDE